MFKLYFVMLSLLLSCSSIAHNFNIIPEPNDIKEKSGKYTFCQSTNIQYAQQFSNEYQHLKLVLQNTFNHKVDDKSSKNCSIGLVYSADVSSDEAYHLSVNEKGIQITARNSKGAFYGVQTLRQMLPINGDLVDLSIQAVEIKDQPKFSWRGVMLDDARQFWGVNKVKAFIDQISYLKFNIFQWHLTDDDGWRIEIKKYPELAKRGGFRGPNEIVPGRYGHEQEKYGGYYTQEQIKEVIAYAAKRHVTVVPEIDVPAHAKIIIELYPELVKDPNDRSIYSSAQDVTGNTINPALATTYQFLDDIYSEVAELFPSQYIHIGGDEIPSGAWEMSPRVLDMMGKKGFTNIKQVQGYFFKRVEELILAKGKTMLGWQEAGDHAKLDKSSVIISWHGKEAGLRAAQSGAKTIMAPADYTYLDLAYNSRPQEPGYRWAGVLSTERAYSYNPIPEAFSQSEANNIMGIQACLWAENLADLDLAEHLIFPRLLAIAETAWTEPERKNWSIFQAKTFNYHLTKLANEGVKYRVPTIKISIENNHWKLNSSYENLISRYTLDGSEPTLSSPIYSQPVAFGKKIIKVKSYDLSRRESTTLEGIDTTIIHQWHKKSAATKNDIVYIPLSKWIQSNGTYRLEFNSESGDTQLISMELLKNDKPYLNLKPSHYTFWQSYKAANYYNFSIDKFLPKESLKLKVVYRGDSKGTHQGKVTIAYSPMYLPDATIFSSIQGEQVGDIKQVIDADLLSNFRSKITPKKGDYVRIDFNNMQQINHIKWLTGESDRDGILLDAKLEYSKDDINFQTIADFDSGKVEKHFGQPITVKSLRITIDKDQKERVFIGDPVIH